MTIFQSANEIAANTVLRKRLDDIQSQTTAEKEWWEKRRASIEAGFMKELDSAPSSNAKTSTSGIKTVSDEDSVVVETASSKKKKANK
jgi:translocation protein SEC66